MIVVKFGGTSLAGVERMRAAARIVAAHRRDQMVVCVVSAMAGVTDALIRIGEIAAQGRPGWQGTITEIRAQHSEIITELTTTTTGATSEIPPRFEAALSALEADLARLSASSQAAHGAQAADIARFSAWGERLSILLFALALRAEGVAGQPFVGEPVVASALRDALVGDKQGGARPWAALEPSLAATRAALASQMAEAMDTGATLVAPGYVARSEDGEVITLGRNGSDYSAAVIGAALRADGVYIYSDVAGVHRADPRVAPQADLLPALTYGDAAELTRQGARILHPATAQTLARSGIPLHLRSALAPEHPGTMIGSSRHVLARGATSNDWVITARPVIASDPLLGLREVYHRSASEQVVVTCVLLDHDDHIADVADAERSEPAHAAMTPRRRFQLIVPAGKSAAIQRQLFAALQYLDQRSALHGLLAMAPALHTMEVR